MLIKKIYNLGKYRLFPICRSITGNGIKKTLKIIKKEFPDLKKHIQYQDVKKNSMYCHLLSWIGPKGAITGFHADWGENINTSIRGKKNFYLVSPKYNECMYPSKKFERATMLCHIDPKNYDEKKFPLFKKAKLKIVIGTEDPDKDILDATISQDLPEEIVEKYKTKLYQEVSLIEDEISRAKISVISFLILELSFNFIKPLDCGSIE